MTEMTNATRLRITQTMHAWRAWQGLQVDGEFEGNLDTIGVEVGSAARETVRRLVEAVRVQLPYVAVPSFSTALGARVTYPVPRHGYLSVRVFESGAMSWGEGASAGASEQTRAHAIAQIIKALEHHYAL